MTQNEFDLLVRGIVFASSTDCCMDSVAVDGIVDALSTFIKENPELAEGLDFGSLYIYGTEPKMQEDPEINAELIDMFGDKLDNHGF